MKFEDTNKQHTSTTHTKEMSLLGLYYQQLQNMLAIIDLSDSSSPSICSRYSLLKNTKKITKLSGTTASKLS